MRKLLYLAIILCLVCLASVYLFIPRQIIVSKAEEVESNERIIAPFLSSANKRRKWWPSDGRTDDEVAGDSSISKYAGYKLDFKNHGYNFNEVLISHGNFKINSIISWGASQNNIIKISWSASVLASNNPVKRLIQYQQAHKLKAHMTIIMESLLTFIVNGKNIYGFNFERLTVKDTILATSSILSSTQPETPEVYKYINSVKKYLQEQGAKQVNPPMLNISKNEQGAYQTTIAVPINKVIKPGPGILINRMIAGNIVVSEIKGGPHTVAEGIKQMNIYVKDFKLVSPAMPFESLVTDRNTEPDTAKWITKIYYPVF